MLLSMTGYGNAEAIINNKKIHVEVKSLNSKNIDVSTRVSSIFFCKDLEIRAYLSKQLVRGKIDFNLWIEDINMVQNATINTTIIHSYIEQIQKISQEEGVGTPENWWSVLSKLPNITQQQNNLELTDELWESTMEAIKVAVAKLIEFRKQEGNAVQQKFEEKIKNIGNHLADVGKYESARIERIKNSLTEGLKSIRGVEYDKNRLEQEMFYYIEKLDINEEKQRLSNHLNYFRETMESGEAQGKKLGFIAQEMGREINTLGSKSNQADMQNLVVMMKDELEQIKEQVLNVL